MRRHPAEAGRLPAPSCCRHSQYQWQQEQGHGSALACWTRSVVGRRRGRIDFASMTWKILLNSIHDADGGQSLCRDHKRALMAFVILAPAPCWRLHGPLIGIAKIYQSHGHGSCDAARQTVCDRNDAIGSPRSSREQQSMGVGQSDHGVVLRVATADAVTSATPRTTCRQVGTGGTARGAPDRTQQCLRCVDNPVDCWICRSADPKA